MTALVRVPFHGDEIECVQREDGVWITLRRACESLGLSVDAQRVKLGAKPWAVTAMIAATGPDGKTYDTFALHLDSVPMWLATIEPARVAESVREKLIAYQREAARVLRDHFFGRPAEPARISVEDIHAIASIAAREAVAAYRQGAEEARLHEASIGDSGHRLVRYTVSESAALTAGGRKAKAYRSVRAGIEADLRASLGWSGTGRAWSLFPSSRWPDLRARLDEIKRAALRAAPSVQPVLDFAKKTDAAE